MFLICSDDCGDEDVLEGIAYHDSGLICYTTGLNDFKNVGGLCRELQDGRFFIKYKDGDDVVLRADREGNELVFYYAVDDFWCVSTSFLGLMIFLQKKGCHLTVSKLEIAKMFVNTSLFEQPYSNNLSVKEIGFLSAEEEVRIVHGVLKVLPRKDDFLSKEKNDGFFKRANGFLKESRGMISSLIEGFNTDLELSGGVDSRIMLGLSLPYKEKLNVSSNKARKNDYIIAKALSSSYGLKFNEIHLGNVGSQDLPRKWLLYKLANVGISRTNPLPNGASGTKFSNTVRLNGGGGGNLKIFYNANISAYFNLIDKSILNEETKIEIKNDLDSSLKAFGYYEKPNQAMVDVYSKHRQRFFAGRAWYYALTGIVYAPMASRSYKSILLADDIEEVFGLDKEEILNRNLISLFLLYLLDPILALAQFDEVKKNFSLEDIELIERLVEDNNGFSLLEDYKNFKIYGDVSSDEVLPVWVESESESDFDFHISYENLIKYELKGVIEKLRQLDIVNEIELVFLEKRLLNNELSKNEKLSLIHFSEIMKRSNFIA